MAYAYEVMCLVDVENEIHNLLIVLSSDTII